MSVTLERPAVADLPAVLAAVATWQREGAPVQLHPGDLGWAWRWGAERLAGDLRVWRRAGRPVAVALLDEQPPVARLAVHPALDDDAARTGAAAEVAGAIAVDLADPARGVLPAAGTVEARAGEALRRRLTETGWVADMAWTPLVRSLADPVEEHGLRLVVLDATAPVGSAGVADRVAVQRAAFDRSTFTADLWRAMAEGPAYASARCVVGYDAEARPVAATTVWSAGPGRPGLIEPLGADREHRGRGHGRAITLAAAQVLRDLGASSVTVCTPSENRRGVAAYASAGLVSHGDVTDFRRPD